MTQSSIRGFQGKWRFLSNFFPCEIDWEGLHYHSTEAAYQASKSTSVEVRKSFTNLDARAARTLGQKIPIRDDWEEVKLNAMYRILREKFSKGAFRELLLSTGKAYLEETNYWHDRFWGVYNGEGLNHLGNLLMLVRDELREGII